MKKWYLFLVIEVLFAASLGYFAFNITPQDKTRNQDVTYEIAMDAFKNNANLLLEYSSEFSYQNRYYQVNLYNGGENTDLYVNDLVNGTQQIYHVVRIADTAIYTYTQMDAEIFDESTEVEITEEAFYEVYDHWLSILTDIDDISVTDSFKEVTSDYFYEYSNEENGFTNKIIVDKNAINYVFVFKDFTSSYSISNNKARFEV